MKHFYMELIHTTPDVFWKTSKRILPGKAVTVTEILSGVKKVRGTNASWKHLQISLVTECWKNKLLLNSSILPQHQLIGILLN